MTKYNISYDRCIVRCCANDERYLERMIVHSNVKHGKIVFHKLPVNEEEQKAWIDAVTKGREDFEEPKHFKVASYVQISSLRKSQLNTIQIQHYC